MPKSEKEQSKIDFLNETFGNSYWNNVVYYCIFDTGFLKKVRNIIPLETFRSKERKIIMRELYNFYDVYKQSPESHFYEVFQDLEKSLSDSDYEKCMNLIGILKETTGKNSQYIYDKLSDALKHFRLEEGAVEFASLIKRKKYDDAKSTILKAMKSSEEEEDSEYYDYFKDKSYIEKRLQEEKYKMKTLIKGLDNIIGGLNPPWLAIILGTPKQGKSFTLLELTVSALFQGLNVMFISLEMDKNVIDIRLDQIIGFMSSKETDEPQDTMKFKRGNWVKDKQNIKSVFDINAVENNRKRFKKIGGGNLMIVARHRGRMNYMDIDRVLDEAEEKDGFIVDLLVVDYLGVMKGTAPGQAKKERIGENCLGLKEICGKRNIIGLSAMQGNRKAMTSKTFQPHMIADDIDVIQHCDMAFALCSTKKEELENKCRLFGAINRHGPMGWTIGLIRDLTIGQVAIGEYELKKEDTEDEENEKAENYY
jgi:replicative DNA helicase